MTTLSPPARGADDLADESSWLEVDASALRHNIAAFRRMLGTAAEGARLGVVLKGNAYGHGFGPVLESVHAHVDCVYVITAQDALALRSWEAMHALPRRDVLVIGSVSPREALALAQAGVSVVVGGPGAFAWAPTLRAAGAPPLDIHLHVDTGLGREGFLVSDLADVHARILAEGGVWRLRGVLSHFANVEDVTEQAYAHQQLERFVAARSLLEQQGSRALESHMAASAASLVLPASRFDTVRVGIALYGLWPSSATRLSTRVVHGEVPELRPVLSWRCRSQTLRRLPAGSHVGYGCTYRCAEPTDVAVLPVGYYDGYPRLLSGKAYVLVGGRRCPVLGRVMMNHLIVDVTKACDPGTTEVTATLLGCEGDEQLTAESLAEWADTISYEIVTRLGAHLPRRRVSAASVPALRAAQ